MTNREKFAEQILNIACGGYPLAVDENTMEPMKCGTYKDCKRCLFDKKSTGCKRLRMEWCESEYVEPQIDWSKVPVDTPILVRDCESDEWIRRYYAGFFSEGRVRAWSGGRTSWSAYDGERRYVAVWNYAKLAEVGDKT